MQALAGTNAYTYHCHKLPIKFSYSTIEKNILSKQVDVKQPAKQPFYLSIIIFDLKNYAVSQNKIFYHPLRKNPSYFSSSSYSHDLIIIYVPPYVIPYCASYQSPSLRPINQQSIYLHTGSPHFYFSPYRNSQAAILYMLQPFPHFVHHEMDLFYQYKKTNSQVPAHYQDYLYIF